MVVFPLLFIFLRATFVATQPWQDPPEEFTDLYTLGTTTTFSTSEDKGSHLTMQEKCIEKFGRMKVIKNRIDDESVAAYFENKKKTEHFIGLILPEQNHYLWTNAVPLGYKNWHDDEPSVETTCEYCTEVTFKGASKFGWNNVYCTTPKNRFAFCEYRQEKQAFLTIAHIMLRKENLFGGAVMFNEDASGNFLEARGAVFFRKQDGTPGMPYAFLKVAIAPSNDLCTAKYKKLPDNLPYDSLIHNLGSFPFVELTSLVFRTDIVRYMPGVKLSQLKDAYLILMLPDNSIFSCHRIKEEQGKWFFRKYNQMLYHLFFDDRAREFMRPMAKNCSQTNINTSDGLDGFP